MNLTMKLNLCNLEGSHINLKIHNLYKTKYKHLGKQTNQNSCGKFFPICFEC